MTDLTVSARFTKSGGLGPGEPATGLTLADIEFFLTEVDRATGAETVVWDSDAVAVNPTFEIDNVGAYARILTTADLDASNYFASARYTGVDVLDQDWVNGSAGLLSVPIGTAIEWTYTVSSTAHVPIQGVKVEIHRNAAGSDVYWVGWTDAFGVLRDTNNLKPRLDAGLWYFFRFHPLYTWNNPDIEDVQ
jgi:hypothetical protein